MKEYNTQRIYDERSPPSVFRGWLTKLRGILTFNPHVRQEGETEIFDAHAYKAYLREQRLKQKSPQTSPIFAFQTPLSPIVSWFTSTILGLFNA
ncbi:hypothetical protein PNOK_0398200 [Pyrrhoderma noxium]|uniref:Uncharacterized protein n=1 Tax=Pyrrhoderma noxium TaxID=2282107 RepID=A0A286UPF6_9AGAM|nr:hypothetical protein PNOK_0398200 [Pyrrhoderma noxium]